MPSKRIVKVVLLHSQVNEEVDALLHCLDCAKVIRNVQRKRASLGRFNVHFDIPYPRDLPVSDSVWAGRSAFAMRTCDIEAEDGFA